MESWFQISCTSTIAIVLTAIGVYISIIAFTRLCGKRSFSKMSGFDFAMTVAIGSIVASTILSKSVSLFQGLVGLAIVYGLQMSVAYSRRYRIVRNLTDNKPLMLMEGETVLYDNLKRGRVTESDLRAKLREANVTRIAQVKAVIFESTGDISVLHNDNDQHLDSYILEDVVK